MPNRHPPLPDIWLISDIRNDAVLEDVLLRLPRGSGVIYRHYHLPAPARFARFRALRQAARRRGHIIVLSGTARESRAWGASGAYAAPARLAYGPAILRLVTAHSLQEIADAVRARADAILLSPVFPTRSHPTGGALGAVRFRLLAARSLVPVIALGGMTAARARRIHTRKWAAIDGLQNGPTSLFSLHS